MFLKFVLAHPAVTCVIPATGKLRNLVDNLGAATGALPDAKQRAQIIPAREFRSLSAGDQASMAEISSSIARMTWAPLARIASKVLPGA